MQIDIEIPGSKSISNRVLVLSALCGKEIIIENLPNCEDTKEMIKNLKRLGAKFSKKKKNILVNGEKIRKNKTKSIQISPSKKTKTINLNTGDAGTATRFISALCALLDKEISLTASEKMRQRPILPLIKALQKLGAKIESKNENLPLKFTPSKLKGKTITLNGNISSQFVSSLLMICPFIEGETVIKILKKPCSKPYIEMTIKLLKKFGLTVQHKNFKEFKIKGIQNPKPPKKIIIEPDTSSASYMGAYGAINPHLKILLKNIYSNSIQGDIAFLTYLKKMGCEIKETKKGTIIKGPKKLKTLGKTDMNKYPDLVMTFAILSIFTQGKTKIHNIENLKIKECDRITGLKNELKKLNVKVKTTKNSIEIQGLEAPKINKKINIETYNDHRMAMCFGILTNNCSKIKIINPKCVQKSYSTFWKDMEKLKKAEKKQKNTTNIVLTGLRGSGKTSIAKIISKKLEMDFKDIDEEIEKHTNKKIKEIIEKKGWEYFRKVEQKICTTIANQENKVIATGGGTIINVINAKKLEKNGYIIYLERSPEDCSKKIYKDDNRPPLTNEKSTKQELIKLFKERKKLYERKSNLKFKRSDNLKKDSEEIIKILKNKNIIK